MPIKKNPANMLSGSPQPNFTNYAEKPIVANRAPSTADVGFALGQIWVDTNGSASYILDVVAGGVATWSLIGAGTGGPLNTLTDTANTVVSPVANNIQIAGTGSQITSTA